MSVTALHRFGAGNLARHVYLRSASPGTEPHVGAPSAYERLAVEGAV
jgi:hypothetical protein